jgi:hypothetical protein
MKRIFASERIFTSHFLIMANIRFKILVLKRLFAKLQANIRIQATIQIGRGGGGGGAETPLGPGKTKKTQRGENFF